MKYLCVIARFRHGVTEIFALVWFYAALVTRYQSTLRKKPKEQRPHEISIYDAENEDAFKKHRKRNRTLSFLYNSASGVRYGRRSLLDMNRSPIMYLCSAGSPLAFYNSSQNSLLCQMYHFRYRYTVALSLRGFHRELNSNKSSASNQKRTSWSFDMILFHYKSRSMDDIELSVSCISL